MRVFGLEITRAARPASAGTGVPALGWLGGVREGFGGAWQRGVVVDSREQILAFSAVYSALDLIAGDIAKLRPKLTRRATGGIWEEIESPAFSPVLRKPNRFQTRIQFYHQWIISKLIHGNTYVLKQRDDRGVVVAMYVLDPRLVSILVTQDGGVYYQLNDDKLSQVVGQIVVPAREVMHDRAACLFHPLVGVGPIYACGISATQGNKIQANSAKFFENMSRPSGVLTAPETIDDVTAERLKRDFEARFSGANIGRLLVLGDGLKYEAMTIPAHQAQLIEQLRWTGEDVARCFHVPAYKLGLGAAPTFNNIAQLHLDYYQQALQGCIEGIEVLLDEGLGLAGEGGQSMSVEFDLDGLLRMDLNSQADMLGRGVAGGYLAPNEARQRLNLAPVAGGDSPFMQQQQWSLEALSKRDGIQSDAPLV